MLEIVNQLAQWIGYGVLSLIVLAVLLKLWLRRLSSNVSDEAKQMAKEVDPNTDIPNDAAAVLMDGMLDGIRDLQPDETVRADPPPVIHFDWSVDDARQEDIEHILSVLQDAGYHTHPLPEVNNHQDRHKWSKELAGVWRSEPDWHIVQFEEDGTMNIREEIDLKLPEQWEPDASTD